jgi:hypothetical protein
MKNIYFLFTALTTFAFVNAQTTTATFEDDSFLSASDVVIGSLATGGIVANPDGAGKVLQVTYGDPSGWDNHGGFEIPIGTTRITGGIVTFKLKSDHGADAGTKGYMLKLEVGSSGNIEKGFAVAGDNTWETISVDLSDCAVGNPNSGNCSGQGKSPEGLLKFLIFHWGGGADAPANNTFYVDDVTWTDGALNAVDATPAQAAPTPTHADADVMSVYSFHYAPSVPVTNVNPGWGQATQTSFEVINGESIVKMKTLNYQGHDLTETDVSSMTHLHADVWSENGGETLAIFPLDGSNPEPRSGPIALQAGWNQVDLELATLPQGIFGGTIKQFKFSNDLNNGANLPLIYVSNLYFYADSTASVGEIQDFELSLYPNPATDIVNINTSISIDNVRLYDLTGRIVMEANPKKESFDLDVTDLSKGVYLVKLSAGNKEATTKLIK